MPAAGIAESPVEPDGVRIPRRAHRSIDWIGPTIFFAGALMAEHPHVVNVCLNVLSSYVFELFRGRETEVMARLKIAVEGKKGGPANVVEYDGLVAGLSELPKIVKSLNE